MWVSIPGLARSPGGGNSNPQAGGGGLTDTEGCGPSLWLNLGRCFIEQNKPTQCCCKIISVKIKIQRSLREGREKCRWGWRSGET